MAKLAAALGRDAASYYLEFRFDDDPRVDFLALLGHRRTAAERLSRAFAGNEHETWRRTLTFLQAWSSDEVCGQIPFVWLEFDGVQEFGGGLPRPNPAFGLEPGYWGRHIRAPIPAEPHWVRSVVRRGVSLLATTTQRASLKCTDVVLCALPPAGSLICATVMMARAPEVTKLYVSVPRLELGTFLERIEWPGDVRAARDFCRDRFGTVEDDIFIDLTIGDRGFTSALGLAWSQFQQGVPAHVDSSWCELLGESTHSEKVDLARSWFGLRETRLGGLRTWVHRWLDLKAVMRPNGMPIQLKGYLGFMPSLPLPFS